jgi:hypothetical protein
MFTSMQVYLGGPAKDEQLREFLPGLVQISKGWSSFISVNSETQGAHFLGWAFPYARVYTYIICTCICTCVHMYNLYMYMLYIYMYIYNINTYVCPCAYVSLGGNFLLRWFQSASQFVARACWKWSADGLRMVECILAWHSWGIGLLIPKKDSS